MTKSIEIKEENIMELNKYIDQLIKENQPSPCIFKKCNADTAAELLKILGISTNECISEKHDGNHKFQFYTNEKQIIRITVYCNGWIQVWVNDDPLYSLYMQYGENFKRGRKVSFLYMIFIFPFIFHIYIETF